MIAIFQRGMEMHVGAQAENFSKAWQTHKTEIRERRQEVLA